MQLGDALTLLVGGPRHVYALLLGVVSTVLQVFIPYRRYVRVLKWLTLSLFAYVGVIFSVQISWGTVIKQTVLPTIHLSGAYITTVVAIFGTTISPYLFFWQASQEIEELHARKLEKPLRDHPEQAPYQLRRIKIDTLIGMGISNLIAFFIMLTTAVTLYAHGLTTIETSAQAAEALRPIAGRFAFLFFTLGIIGTGMLAVPVRAGSAAFAIAEAFRWKRGLELKPSGGVRFYSVIALATLIGIGLGFTRLDPIKALFWSAVLNGVISVPIMAVMMRLAVNTKVMGAFVISGRLHILGWLATAAMTIAVIVMLVQMVV